MGAGAEGACGGAVTGAAVSSKGEGVAGRGGGAAGAGGAGLASATACAPTAKAGVKCSKSGGPAFPGAAAGGAKGFLAGATGDGMDGAGSAAGGGGGGVMDGTRAAGGGGGGIMDGAGSAGVWPGAGLVSSGVGGIRGRGEGEGGPGTWKTAWHLRQRTRAPCGGIFSSAMVYRVLHELHSTCIHALDSRSGSDNRVDPSYRRSRGSSFGESFTRSPDSAPRPRNGPRSSS